MARKEEPLLKRSLYFKFLLTYGFFALASLLVVLLFSSRFAFLTQRDITARNLYVMALDIADEVSIFYERGRLPESLQSQVEGMTELGYVRAWLVTPNGQITLDSSNILNGTRIHGFDPSEPPTFYRTGRFYGLFTADMLSVLAPVTANMQVRGYVVLHIYLQSVRDSADRMLGVFHLTAVILFLLSLSLLLVLHLTVMKPLKKITDAAIQIGSGNLKEGISLKQNDEIGFLADTLDLMAKDLARSEEYQRKFIANVSHDFRSPLTSIKGYLNAIIDGTIPPESQEKYLRIIIHATDRLVNLTQSILSLNSLEREGTLLETSDFDICQLARNVCYTFEGKCLHRGITFDLIFSSVSILVHADMGRIQQVLSNLIDNAIKFSRDNSSIAVSIQIMRSKALISVKDHGIGIPKKDQTKIWARFFKSDQSRGKDKEGTGLGLAIVREIIAAHGETIDVVSTEGAGTEFTFRLPLAKTEKAE